MEWDGIEWDEYQQITEIDRATFYELIHCGRQCLPGQESVPHLCHVFTHFLGVSLPKFPEFLHVYILYIHVTPNIFLVQCFIFINVHLLVPLLLLLLLLLLHFPPIRLYILLTIISIAIFIYISIRFGRYSLKLVLFSS